MEYSIPGGLALIIILGAAAQWLGWRLRLPSILLLLICGFVAGPEVLGLVRPDVIFGPLLIPAVSMGVAILLFEGALTLSLKELAQDRGVVAKLVTLGAGVTWVLAGVGAWLLLGLHPALAALLGAILTVTGPTVVLPLLRQVRPTGSAGSILKWEGILIDPIGAVLAVLVFEGIVHGGALRPALGRAAWGLLKTLVVGGAAGALGAWMLMELLKRFWLPDHLHSAAALALAVGAYAGANVFQHEAGLLSVTLMGVILANQRQVPIKHILEFKENLQVLLIAALFILLAARVKLETLAMLETGAFVFLALLIILVRPVAIWACTRGTDLTRQTRIFLAAMAPRGVVAAAVTAVFALRLEDMYPQARILVPVMFLVIVGTVAIYGLLAGPLAYRLGLARPNPEGVLMVGAHRFARGLAVALTKANVPVLVTDTNARWIGKARLEGLRTYHGSPLTEHADEEVDLAGMGRIFALTPNDEVNALSSLHYAHLFGRREVYQVALSDKPGKDADAFPTHLRARTLFGEEWTYDALTERWDKGARYKATKLSEQFGYDAWREEHGDGAIPMLTVDDEGRVKVATVDRPLDPQPGETLIALVDEAA